MNYIVQNRGLLLLSGEDVRSFLQGLITNDIHKLSHQKNLYAAMLTPQGKFLYDFFIYDFEGGVVLEYYQPKAVDILKKLTMYRLRSKVQFTPLEGYVVVAGWGEERGLPDPRDARMGYRYITSQPPENTATAEEYHARRIGFTIPEMPNDLISEESFPLPSNLEEINAIDYKKGCFVGQEVTARSKYRGNIRKHIYTLTFKHTPPATGSEIRLENKVVGTMLSSSGNIGLAQLETDAVDAVRGEFTIS